MGALLSLLKSIEKVGMVPNNVDWGAITADLEGLGYDVNIGGSQVLTSSLKAYTLKPRELALRHIMSDGDGGPSYYDAYIESVSSLVVPGQNLSLTTWGAPIQPTEATGSVVVGMRRFWFDIIARALGCMNPVLFHLHVRAAYVNGIIFARRNGYPADGYPALPVGDDYMRIATETSGGKEVLPASIPPGYIPKLIEFLGLTAE